MYLLKVEAGNGYQYCELPKNFKLTYCSERLETESINLKLILSCKEHFNSCDFVREDSVKNRKSVYILPRYIGKDITRKEDLPIPTFKVITYTRTSEDNNKVHYIESIVFNGRGYLIKESGKTIEKF